jgi:hypothetical protein
LEHWEPAAAEVVERAHLVSVDFVPGAATLRVTRRFQNTAPTHRGLRLHLPLPEDGVVTGFRTSTRDGALEPAALVSAEEASAQWAHLTAPGLAAPSTLARLDWSPGDDGVEFELFGLPPSELVEVRYDILAPAHYEAGAVSVDVPVPPATSGLLAPSFPAGLVDEAAGLEDTVRLARAWVTDEVLDARWGTFPLDAERTLWRLELDVAPVLSRLPVRPAVVFAVDASHSQGPAGIAAQLALLAPYLAHVPDARVEVVLYRRFAERLFGAFIPAAEVAARLASLPPERLAPGNGSHLDRAAQLAAEALARESGERRLVLLTDGALREALTPDVLSASMVGLPADTIVHVVERAAERGERALRTSRDDDTPWARVASTWGGIFARVSGSVADAPQATRAVLELVRPVRLDGFTVDAPGLKGDLEPEPELEEGEGLRVAGIGAAVPEAVTVTGRLWAREVRFAVTANPTFSSRLPALAVGTPSLRASLSEDELLTASFVSGVLSPVTSFLAAPRDAAPSVIGVDKGFGVGGVGGISCGSRCSFGTSCAFGASTGSFDAASHLRQLLAPALAECAARHGDASGATLTIENTWDEVVDVAAHAPSAALADCLTEVAWNLRLTRAFGAHRRLQLAW